MTKKLCMADAEFIRLYNELGFTVAQIAREYEVHPDTIRSVVTGKSFRTGSTQTMSLQVKRRKLSPDQVRIIRHLAARGHGEQAISKVLNGVVQRGTIRQVIAGQTYKDVT